MYVLLMKNPENGCATLLVDGSYIMASDLREGSAQLVEAVAERLAAAVGVTLRVEDGGDLCPNPVPLGLPAPAVSVRTIIGARAYAVISYPGGVMDVLLDAGRSAESSLRKSADEMRVKAADILRRAAIIEAAANAIASKRLVPAEPSDRVCAPA